MPGCRSCLLIGSPVFEGSWGEQAAVFRLLQTVCWLLDPTMSPGKNPCTSPPHAQGMCGTCAGKGATTSSCLATALACRPTRSVRPDVQYRF